VTLPPGDGGVDNWPQAGGPDGTFRVNVDGAPTKWSVAANQNILWTGTLPDEGQGGIAVWGDTLFLETFPPFTGKTSSLDVMGHAIDRATGKIKWSVNLKGSGGVVSPIAYFYSDATSWTPVTDGQHVWFFDSGGELGCWDWQGNMVWTRTFPGVPDPFKFNRQHEPILFGDTIIINSPMAADDPPAPHADWNYLHGIDKATGKTTWIAQDASTMYSTAVMGRMADGTPAMLHGRGGPHGVPEAPQGLSLTSLAPGSEGKSLWQYHSSSGTALYTQTWDAKYAYWFNTSPEAHVVLDATTGKVLRTQSLFENVDLRTWDKGTNKYVVRTGVNVHTDLGQHVMPNWHTNIAANGYHWFLTSTGNNRSPGPGVSGPAHCLGRVNIETGKVEFLELPVGVSRAPGMPERFLYGTQPNKAEDYQGHAIAGDGRSNADGWVAPAFFASPVMVGTKIYFGTAMGVTYVIDSTAAVLDEKALLGVGDLGPMGTTWSLAGPSFAGGIMYHHSSKQVVAIGP
jgi:PQQ-like domain